MNEPIDSGLEPLNSTLATLPGQLTEIIGLPGLGKTQLCIQLSSSVLKRKSRIIYIDTEGSFTLKRLLEMTGSLINTNDLKVYRIFSLSQLTSLIQELESILLDFSNVKLIIIDSIAFLFKGISDYGQRSVFLNSIGQELKKIAYEKKILIVLTNQMTTKIHNNQGILVPALGNSSRLKNRRKLGTCL